MGISLELKPFTGDVALHAEGASADDRIRVVPQREGLAQPPRPRERLEEMAGKHRHAVEESLGGRIGGCEIDGDGVVVQLSDDDRLASNDEERPLW